MWVSFVFIVYTVSDIIVTIDRTTSTRFPPSQNDDKFAFLFAIPALTLAANSKDLAASDGIAASGSLTTTAAAASISDSTSSCRGGAQIGAI
jgi:hypothetical protein